MGFIFMFVSNNKNLNSNRRDCTDYVIEHGMVINRSSTSGLYLAPSCPVSGCEWRQLLSNLSCLETLLKS